MTVLSLRPSGRIARPGLVLAGLAVVVGLRWAATTWGSAGPIAIGLVFGIGLLVVAVAGGWRPVPEGRASVVIGAAGGAVLVVLAVVTNPGQAPPLAPFAAFPP